MIGIKYQDAYAVIETFQLLKIEWNWYDPAKTYDVVIAKKQDVPDYHGNLIDITDNDLFQNIRDLLNEGKMHLHQPDIEYWLDDLRTKLKQYTTLIEIPSSPWNYPYMVAMTHDVDNISVRQSPFRTICVAALQCFLQYDIPAGINILLAKLRLAEDPWALFDKWKKLESDLGVKSTFYIISSHITDNIRSHPYRKAGYIFDQKVVEQLQADGWEVGVHGMNNWASTRLGREERKAIKGSVGNRTHWLLHHRVSWNLLSGAGYDYDSTFGYDDDIGYRAGTTQVYQPEGAASLLELPLHIQDMGLFGKECWAPSNGDWVKIPCLDYPEDIAKNLCNAMLYHGKRFGGVITVLWHYEDLAPPREWNMMRTYHHIIKIAKQDGAWITTAKNVVDWFRIRRNTQVGQSISAGKITIRVQQPEGLEHIPSQKVRVHIDPLLIKYIDAPFVNGDRYIDIRCDRPEITVLLT